MHAPRIFLSYASEVEAWVKGFKEFFKPGNAYIKDYQSGDNLPFGDLNKWLEEEIGTAAAVVLIVSEEYTKKKYTLKEWQEALSQVASRHVVFVPVMIHADAKAWWADQKRSGALSELGSAFAYCDLTDAGGHAKNINNDFGPITAVASQIASLAGEVKKHLDSIVASSATAAENPTVPARPAVLVLGHPDSKSIEDVAEAARQLIAHLRNDGLEPVVWDDGWREPEARQGAGVLAPEQRLLVVQPLARGAAGDYAESSDGLRKWVEDAIAADMPPGAGQSPAIRLVPWLPRHLRNEQFEARVAAAQDDPEVALRHDDPKALADWLGSQLGDAASAKAAVLVLEMLGPGSPARLRGALHDGFYKIVETEVPPPIKRWFFSNGMITDQLKLVPADRVIIAIHDLNTGHAKNHEEARAQLELKMGEVRQATERAGRKDLKIFHSVLLVTKTGMMPWIKYEQPSVFEEWCLMPFSDTADGLAPTETAVEPFRTCLKDWVAAEHGRP